MLEIIVSKDSTLGSWCPQSF